MWVWVRVGVWVRVRVKHARSVRILYVAAMRLLPPTASPPTTVLRLSAGLPCRPLQGSCGFGVGVVGLH